MVYVNDTLYQIVDSQPNFADEKSSFNLLGKIENTVSSSEEPKENFQANDDIVGAAVYQYGDNIVVEFEGKYWLYEHYHNTDFDGNSDGYDPLPNNQTSGEEVSEQDPAAN